MKGKRRDERKQTSEREELDRRGGERERSKGGEGSNKSKFFFCFKSTAALI